MQASSVHQPDTPASETIMPLDNAPLTLVDFKDQLSDTMNNREAKVIVSCNYCTSFRSVLNSETWENILNHILPVAKEELHTSFYGSILANFSRGLKIQVVGRTKEMCEVIVSHGLVCRKTGAWFQVDQPSIQLAIRLARHIAAQQPRISGSCGGARPRDNSIICLFCSSPFTAVEYQKHLSSHQGQIYRCLLLITGAYCSDSFKTDIKKIIQCSSCAEGEHQDFRFLPCYKYPQEYSCTKKLQATVQIFRENFAYGGFLQVTNTALTKCCVCQNQRPTYCALFKITNPILVEHGQNDMLAVCSNCQRQFVNVVMRENGFDKQLNMYQLHHMQQISGVLRVILSVRQKICNGQYNVLYTVQEGGTFYSSKSTLHKVVPAKLMELDNHLGNNTPARGGVILEENNDIDMSGPSIRFVCDECKFSVDLTRLEHKQAKSETHLVEMSLAVVLEHTVPHTKSLVSVITTAANNEMFDLKFEFNAVVEGEGSNRCINVSLDRKIIPTGGTAEISIQKDIYKTIEAIKSKLTPDKRGNIKLMNRYVFLDHPQPKILPGQHAKLGTSIDMNIFLNKAKSTLSLYGSAGCNTILQKYYSECKLCAKFSFPDFRLTAGMQPQTANASTSTEAIFNSSGMTANSSGSSSTTAATGSVTNALCENCCETTLSLCGSSAPGRLMGRGDNCLLLGVDMNSGHKLSLSNQVKKWISADGLKTIKTILDVAALSNICDYRSILVQNFCSYLKAVCSRAWSDPNCIKVRAGFIVKPSVAGQSSQIEIKVTQRPRPPKSKNSLLVGPGRFGDIIFGVPVSAGSLGRGQGGKAPTTLHNNLTGRGIIRGPPPISVTTSSGFRFGVPVPVEPVGRRQEGKVPTTTQTNSIGRNALRNPPPISDTTISGFRFGVPVPVEPVGRGQVGKAPTTTQNNSTGRDALRNPPPINDTTSKGFRFGVPVPLGRGQGGKAPTTTQNNSTGRNASRNPPPISDTNSKGFRFGVPVPLGRGQGGKAPTTTQNNSTGRGVIRDPTPISDTTSGIRFGVPVPIGRNRTFVPVISQSSLTGRGDIRGSTPSRGPSAKMNPYHRWLESCQFPTYADWYDWMEVIAAMRMGLTELPFPLSALEQPGVQPCPEILAFIDRCMKAANGDNSEAEVKKLIKYLKDNPPKESFENPKFKEEYTKDEKDLMQHILHFGLELPGSRHNPYGHLQTFSSFFIDMFFGNYTEFMDHVNSLTKEDLQKELKRREGYCQLSPIFASIIGSKLVDLEKKNFFTSKEVKEFRSMYSGCNENKHLAIMTKLVQLGADVKAHDIFGFTPLHYAVLSRHEGMVTVLLKNGANPNAESGDGFRPLTSLICAGNENTLRLIDHILQYNGKVIDKKDIEEIRNKVQLNGSRELAVRVREAHPRDKSKCEKCVRPAEKKCSACSLVFYCSPACQKGDWKFHKVTCKKVRAK